MPDITTLIPVFNGARFIREAVDSALAQRGVDNEIIVIDDGSTDETPAILESYGKAIHVLRQLNSGHVKARNNGAALANGTWLAFLDADDQWLPDKLCKQMAVATSDVGMVYTDRENFGAVERLAITHSTGCHLYDGDIFETLLFGNFITAASAVIRNDWFTKLGGFREGPWGCEDWDLWLRFAAAGGLAGVVREPLTRYRWHTSSMSNNHIRMCAGRLNVVQSALATPRAAPLPRHVRRRAIACAWQCSAWHAIPWRRTTAVWWYARSILNWPWELSVYKQLVKCCLPVRC